MQVFQPLGHRAVRGGFGGGEPVISLPGQEVEPSVLGDSYLAGQAAEAEPVPQWTTAKFALALGLPSSCFPAPWFVLRPLIQKDHPGGIDHVGLYTAGFEVSMQILHLDHVVIDVPPDLQYGMIVVIRQAVLAHRLATAGEAEERPFVLLQPWVLLALVEECAGEQPGQPGLNFHLFLRLFLGGRQRGFFVLFDRHPSHVSSSSSFPPPSHRLPLALALHVSSGGSRIAPPSPSLPIGSWDTHHDQGNSVLEAQDANRDGRPLVANFARSRGRRDLSKRLKGTFATRTADGDVLRHRWRDGTAEERRRGAKGECKNEDRRGRSPRRGVRSWGTPRSPPSKICSWMTGIPPSRERLRGRKGGKKMDLAVVLVSTPT